MRDLTTRAERREGRVGGLIAVMVPLGDCFFFLSLSANSNLSMRGAKATPIESLLLYTYQRCNGSFWFNFVFYSFLKIDI